MTDRKSFVGPEPIELPPLPQASPQPPKMKGGDTQPGIASTEYVKKKLHNSNLWTRLVGAAVAAAVTAALGFFFSRHTDETKEQVDQVDAASLERMVKVEQRLADHIDTENARHAETQQRLDRIDRRGARIDAKLDLELDRHGVPRSKRPADSEPAGPPGESK